MFDGSNPPGLNATWVLILAAGASSRFGSSKALAPWRNGTLLSHAIDHAVAVTGTRVMAVLGAHAEALKNHVQAVHSVMNAQWRQGMGHSIAVGVQAIIELDSCVEAVVILPVDQPLASSFHLIQLAQACFQTGNIVLTANGQEKGPPVCLPRCYFSRALALNSDQGLKSILSDLNHQTIQHPQAFLDADTPAALQDLLEMAEI